MNLAAIKTKLQEYKFFSDLLTGSSFEQLTRYLITGFLSFGIEYLMFFILYHLLSVGYITANVIVYAVVFWINFLLNRFWSFKSQDNLLRQLKLYSLLFIFNLLVVNVFLMYVLSEIAGIPPLISKVLLMGVVVLWNFILYKKVIYR